MKSWLALFTDGISTALKDPFELHESFANCAPSGTTRLWNHQCNDFSTGCEVNPDHCGARRMNEPLL